MGKYEFQSNKKVVGPSSILAILLRMTKNDFSTLSKDLGDHSKPSGIRNLNDFYDNISPFLGVIL
jgi:hypothetical protein